MSLQILLSIAQAIFVLDHGQTNIHTEFLTDTIESPSLHPSTAMVIAASLGNNSSVDVFGAVIMVYYHRGTSPGSCDECIHADTISDCDEEYYSTVLMDSCLCVEMR